MASAIKRIVAAQDDFIRDLEEKNKKLYARVKQGRAYKQVLMPHAQHFTFTTHPPCLAHTQQQAEQATAEAEQWRSEAARLEGVVAERDAAVAELTRQVQSLQQSHGQLKGQLQDQTHRTR